MKSRVFQAAHTTQNLTLYTTALVQYSIQSKLLNGNGINLRTSFSIFTKNKNGMHIYKNVPLKKYNSFGLNYIADCLVHIRTYKDAVALFSGKIAIKEPVKILGGGSNILFTENFKGTLIYPEFKGIRAEKPDGEQVIISAGAGVLWDDLVEWTISRGYGGLENLSLIPGTVGASAVQNIGAYGVEVKDIILKVKAISLRDGSIRIFTNSECEFGYRTSIFKKSEKDKYLITRVFYRLSINPLLNLNYGSVRDEVEKLGDATLENVRRAVINIRTDKLADPKTIGNAGSFFKNPVVTHSIAAHLKEKYPQMPLYSDQSEGTKLAAGWLIEMCGWKGKRFGEAGVHDKQALVLVNHGKATGKEIYDLSEAIRKSVKEKFGVELEREVEVTGII
jgi:UDP-N-acetylmuramate dehydrogenase